MSLAAHQHDHEGAEAAEALGTGADRAIVVVEPDREELIGAHPEQDFGANLEPVHVYRNGMVAGVLGAGAAVLAIAWLRRAIVTGGLFDWALVALTAALALTWLIAFVDARSPLLVADRHGLRLRLGRSWRGLPWSDITHVRHLPREGLRDGRLVVVARDEQALVDSLSGRAARAARLSTRLYGAPLALPLGLTTRTSSADLGADLEELAAAAVAVPAPELDLEIPQTRDAEVATTDDLDVPGAQTPEEVFESGDRELGATTGGEHLDESEDDEPDLAAAERRLPDPRPQLAALINRASSWFERPQRSSSDLLDEPLDDDVEQPGLEPQAPAPAAVMASPTPPAARAPRVASRAEIHREADEVALSLREPEHEPDHESDDGELAAVWDERVRPIAREGHPVDELVIADFVVEPAADPVIGPELRAARTRLGLSVDELAARTRIRPHVIEAIEVDDFVPCGGDFYARGHLRTMCRILGVEAADLIESFDQRYAHAPLDPRRVFEAELATGTHGTIRSMRGGPNWSILIAAVMALVLLWSVARLVMDAPPELRGDTPVLNGSGGPHAGAAAVADPVPVSITASQVGARIVVRDATGKVVFKGNLAIGEAKTLRASPPVRVQSSDAAVQVAVDGQAPRTIGEAGTPGQGTFTVR